MQKIKIKQILLGLLMLLSLGMWGQNVSVNEAEKVASNFLKLINPKSTFVISNAEEIKDDEGSLMYFFKVNDGFVIVANDKKAFPILAYNENKNFATLASTNNEFQFWLSELKKQIRVLKQGISAPTLNKPAEIWNDLLLNSTKIKLISNLKGCPLSLNTETYNQKQPYNSLCPQSAQGVRAVTGCVATAMSEIMDYYNYPAKGNGQVTWNDTSTDVVGNLTFNLSDQNYNWNNVSDMDKAKISYHAGLAVNMNYGTISSGATLGNLRNALVNNFRFSSATIVPRSTNGISNWYSILKAEICNNRPVIYTGVGNVGGHAWVADGVVSFTIRFWTFNTTIDTPFAYMNWGWGGAFNGYYYLDNIVANNVYNFNTNQSIVKIVK
ncbi:hypothetical protein B0A58_09405 [Flavobacterium branchiophilum NBRC 15030 = ATCC 35035]|uniref:Streptopain n=1 Tax=Flavobacterium branchiophilum TaxID=55197 RepID=A0A543G4I6_9FLAO|nr:C10 family peptidase [Flavobacterium branchiophilum]OXA75030.1 hypothetical protein B0A58_09405 [Flavobacterium branchiophilum NBRC 15030 = ATCC 35035]TQM41013.1 streptopain [Flavobacterium branchiophilum]GEM55987.1 streptopain [Flavobacterium branchiophilum NBRC 15030 = ATCC 35035]